MRTKLGFLIVVGLLVSLPHPGLAQVDKIAWHTDRAKAYDIARAENKPVLIYLWTQRRRKSERAPLSTDEYTAEPEVHPYSRDYTKSMWESKKVVAESGRFVCVSVDIDRADEFTQRCLGLGAQVIFTDPAGNVLATFKGRRNTGVGLGGLIYRSDHALKAMRDVRWPPGT